MNYLASHHAGAEVVCSSLNQHQEKAQWFVHKVLLCEVAERLVCAGCTAGASQYPWGRHRDSFPGELCAGTAYHCSSSQNSSTPPHPLAHSLLQRPQGERRGSCPPEGFSLTPHKQYCFLSEMYRTKYSLCFKVVKLARKGKMRSISRERKYPPGILLHLNWIRKRSLSCVTFAVCSESSVWKTQQSTPSWYHTYSFNTPRLPCTPAWSPVHRDSLWAFKHCISGRAPK